jgi:hypothetical protein
VKSGTKSRKRIRPNKERRATRRTDVDLAEFLRTNPWSTIQRDPKKIRIELPWNDASLELVVRNAKGDPGSKCLNHIVLPERFNAVYHRDRRCIEYIFNHLFDTDDPMPSQQFAFRWRSHDYTCRYGPASERVLFLARAFRPVRGSVSDHRHLEEIQDFQLQDRLPKQLRGFFESKIAISFFVDDVGNYEEELFIDLAKHLNFYLSYFERSSPQIDILPVTPPATTPSASGPPRPEIVPPLITAADSIPSFWT